MLTDLFRPSSAVTNALGDRWAVLSAEAKRRGVTVAVIDGGDSGDRAGARPPLGTRNVKDFAGLGVTTINQWKAD